MAVKAKSKTKKQVEPEVVETPQDYLMWVGAVYYPTAESFISEAQSMGTCKRLGRLPGNLTLGQSRVFLAHDEGLVGEGFVFGYFIPDTFEYLVQSEDDLPDNLYDKVTPVFMNGLEEDPRGCGTREQGLYLVAQQEKNGNGPSLVVFDKPRKLAKFDADRGHFRGLLRIEYGDKMIDTKNTRNLMVPPSQKAHKPVDGNNWTEKQDQALLAFFDGSDNKAGSAQKYSYKTGRPKSSILYRFNKLMNGSEE